MSRTDMSVPNQTTSGFVPERFTDADGRVRVRLVAVRHKFTDEAKAAFVLELAKHGIKGRAARVAGVTTTTVNRHLKEDPDFAEATLAAKEEYQAKLLEHHQDLVFNGVEKRTYDRNGNLISEEVQYPIRLIELELKKVDQEYREKREVDVNVSGGVLVAPAAVASIEDWEDRFSQPKVVDGASAAIDEAPASPGQIIDGEIADEGET